MRMNVIKTIITINGLIKSKIPKKNKDRIINKIKSIIRMNIILMIDSE